MNKIPTNIRKWIAIGLFIYTFGGIVSIIVISQLDLEKYVLVLVSINTFISFVLAFVFVPLNKEEIEKIQKRSKSKKNKPNKPKKEKEPFISEKEWEELEEEEDEIEAMEMMDDD